jgi:hypothetical protein
MGIPLDLDADRSFRRGPSWGEVAFSVQAKGCSRQLTIAVIEMVFNPAEYADSDSPLFEIVEGQCVGA